MVTRFAMIRTVSCNF